MTKASKEKILKDEIIVLNILQQHAKESIGEIAKKCGLSHQKVWRIIKNLEQNKKIWGYSAILDEEAKELKHFVLLVKRSTVPLNASMQKEVILEKLDDYVPDEVKIDDILLTHGRYSAIVTFSATDLLTAKKLVSEMFKRIEEYIEEFLLLETLFPIRKNGFKNPQIEKLVEYI